MRQNFILLHSFRIFSFWSAGFMVLQSHGGAKVLNPWQPEKNKQTDTQTERQRQETETERNQSSDG